ncbi:ATP-dependent Clp protease proteolytic subunit-related protein 3, chloroplastic-like isoform X1 [Cucurbita maxima]|uniref:ATP-dependent Clp protease proteolytic subunit-related protein 3, chloroplastic-like isoform X1 n=1 Tax=Cucurbita maxima TaxID=3661 RepID=A0A6J1HQN5_CUCMA|nr:ATP-dependent Clp protease proteolytic subunit-related protein 3, chloroplastic-like isoform X1 [Cucurbita maxima]
MAGIKENYGSHHEIRVERSVSYSEHTSRRPPPELPSLLLHGRIIYIGMPFVPAVRELVIAELMYLQWMDPKEPIYLYINSTGTTRDDDETLLDPQSVKLGWV